MDKFTLERDFDHELKNQNIDTREPKRIVFNVPKDLNIYEFRIMCIRMSQALGYGENNIMDAFGPVDTPYYMVEDDIEIREHIFDLMHDKEKIDKFIQNDESVSPSEEKEDEN